MPNLSKDQLYALINEREDRFPKSIRSDIFQKLSNLPKLNKQTVRKILDSVEDAYLRSLVEPGEAIGTVAAQSIGEPGTQMSVPGNEKVILKSNSISRIIEIGDFVDELITTLSPYEFKDSMICDLPESSGIYVPSLGFDEKIQWNRLLQVSRHKPNGQLLKITTRSGREITATLSHSFVIREDNKIVPIEGRNLCLGHRIPLVKSLPADSPILSLPLDMYLARNEIWYGSEVAQIATTRDLEGRSWLQHIDFSKVPVKGETLRKDLDRGAKDKLLPGFKYPKMQHSEHTRIPEEIPLDPLFGWFIGAYLAEGTNTRNYIVITNINENYLKKARLFADKLGVNHQTIESEGEYGPSISVNIYSTLLCRLFDKMCGKGAKDKHIPFWSINASKDFIGSLLKGYFDGDGSISVEKSQIRVSSKSKELLDGICLLLSRVGIFASKHRTDKDSFLIRIPGKYVSTFKNSIGSDIPHKIRSLNKLADQEKEKIKIGKHTYDKIDMIPGFGELLKEIGSMSGISSKSSLAAKIRKFTKNQLIDRQTLGRYLEEFNKFRCDNETFNEKMQILHQAYDGGTIWDEITKLELISSPTEFVYDFTVEENETFMTFEGLITHNTLKTFHYAGVAELNVTLGLPRLIEILDARKNPASPFMTVYLEEAFSKDKEKAQEVQRMIELSTVESVSDDITVDLALMQIKISLNDILMKDKGLTPDLIIEKLSKLKKGEVFLSNNEIIIDSKDLTIDDIYKLNEKIRDLKLKGVKGISRVIISKDQELDEWVLFTAGSNLPDVLSIPGVDPTRIKTNHIQEIRDTLGIEATRQAIIDEATAVLQDQGLDVDIRHIMLVSDIMTQDGNLRQIGRHGISGEKESVLARASFEVTVKHLLNSAARGELDKLRGITENVIIGQIIPLGTGTVDLIMWSGYQRDNKRVKDV
ncbi:MAG: DNA-directed RNA polymerase subunit A'' [Candidatus Hodarchaeota archaeon]